MSGETKVNERAIKWRKDLAETLKQWCDANGYPTRNLLAKELGIPDSRWSRIIAGTAITDWDSYAKIQVRTGLDEADPTKIPPKIVMIPGKDKFMEVSRSIGEDEYNRWLQGKGQKYRHESQRSVGETSKRSMPVTGIPTFQLPPQQSVGATIDLVLGSFAAQLVAQFHAQVSSAQTGMSSQEITGLRQAVETLRDEFVRLRNEIQPRTVPDDKTAFSQSTRRATSRDSVGRLAQLLYEALQRARQGTVADRDRLVEEHGRDIGRLLPLLEAFTEPTEKRERSLQRTMEVRI